MKTLAVFLSVAVLASCGPVSSEDSVLPAIFGNLINCNSDLSLCVKEHALKAAERLGAVRKLKLFDGVTILNHSPKEVRSLESLSTEPTLRNKQVTEKLWESTSEILQSTELELSYSGTDGDEAENRSFDNEVDEGRSKKKKETKKKLKMLIPLILLAKAKAAAIVITALVIIAVSVFKLAMVAKIAFLIKLIGIVKALLSKKEGHEQITWQPQGWDAHAEHHPIPVEQGHGWESGWSRSKNDANNLAYSGYGI